MMQDKIDLWIAEIRKYNRLLHLVGSEMFNDFETHVKDCMELLENINEPEIADIGSGSGLPAVPYKIMNPESKMFMIERSQKKCTFLRGVVRILGLDNTFILEEDPLVNTVGPFEAVMSRAFSPKENLEKVLRRILLPGGVFYYMSTTGLPGLDSSEFRQEDHFITESGKLHLQVFRFTPSK